MNSINSPNISAVSSKDTENLSVLSEMLGTDNSDAAVNFFENEKNDLSRPVLSGAHCPRCHALYTVQVQVLKNASCDPEFKCLTCPTRFAIPIQNPWLIGGKTFKTYEVEQIPGTVLQNEVNGGVSGRVNSEVNSETRNEAVIAAPLRKNRAIMAAGSKELNGLWESIMRSYETIDLHEKFINRCFELNELRFAAQKYGQIIAVSPNEEIAQNMRKRILSLAHLQTMVQSDRAPWNFRIPAFNNLILVLGGACLTTGILLPGMKSLVAVGIVAILIALGLRWFLRPSW